MDMDDFGGNIPELYFQEEVSQEPDQSESIEMPLNDFTFDVTSMFNQTEISFNEPNASIFNDSEISFNEPKIESCEHDFTFDVSSIFATNTLEDPKVETDVAVKPYKEDDLDDNDHHSIEQDILYEDAFDIDHNEEIDADEDCAPEKIHSQRFLKELRTLNFNHQTKHAIATLAHICHINCEPYIASPALNEHLQWMSDRPIVRELDKEEVFKFYNSAKSSINSEIKSDCTINRKRTRLCRKQKECSEIELSNDLSRVLQNEVILNAEDHDNLSPVQIKEITSQATVMVQNIFRGFYNDRFSRNVKKKKIRGTRSKNLCNSLLVHKRTKKDFKGELLHKRPVWSKSSVKMGCYEREFAINTQVDILGKPNLKKWYYSRNKLIKDMR